MDKTIESLNYARLCLLAGKEEEGYVTLVEIIDDLVTKEIKKNQKSM